MHRKYTYSKIGTRNYFDNYFIHVCILVLISLIILRLRDVGVQSWGHGLRLETGVGVDLLEPLRDARVREAQVLQRGERVRGQRGGGEQKRQGEGRKTVSKPQRTTGEPSLLLRHLHHPGLQGSGRL